MRSNTVSGTAMRGASAPTSEDALELAASARVDVGLPSPDSVSVETNSKRDVTLQAHAALQGITLLRLGNGRWHAGRWDLSRELDDAEVEVWLAGCDRELLVDDEDVQQRRNGRGVGAEGARSDSTSTRRRSAAIPKRRMRMHTEDLSPDETAARAAGTAFSRKVETSSSIVRRADLAPATVTFRTDPCRCQARGLCETCVAWADHIRAVEARRQAWAAYEEGGK